MAYQGPKLDDKSELNAYAYWHSHTIACFTPATIRKFGLGFVIAAFVLLFGGFLLYTVTGFLEAATHTFKGFLLTLPLLIAALVLFAGAYFMYSLAEVIEECLKSDDNEGKQRREPLVRRIREFARRQEKYRAIVDMDFPTGHQWGLARVHEILEEWPTDIKEHGALEADPEYPIALKDIYRKWSPGSGPVHEIWQRRMEIYNWLFINTTKTDRETARGKSSAQAEFEIQQERTVLGSRLKDLDEQIKRVRDHKEPWNE